MTNIASDFFPHPYNEGSIWGVLNWLVIQTMEVSVSLLNDGVYFQESSFCYFFSVGKMKKTKKWLIFWSPKCQEALILVRNRIERLQVQPSRPTSTYSPSKKQHCLLWMTVWKSLWVFQVCQPDDQDAEPSRPPHPSPRRVSPCSKSVAASPAPSCSPKWWLPLQVQHQSLRQKPSICNFLLLCSLKYLLCR